jgi:serine protease Do/serine protease DegQ
MTRRLSAAGLAVFLCLSFGTGGQAATAPLPSLAPVLEKASPAVVNISVRGKMEAQNNPLFQDPNFRRFFDDPMFRRFFQGPEGQQPQQQETQSIGSGVIIDAKNGYVITNNHVVQHADEIIVRLADQRRVSAKVVGTDPELDVAVIKLASTKGLSQLEMGNSDTLKPGDFVLAIGSPFGLGQTATLGIVSATGRTGLGIEGYEDFIQTDASINPGNSGGALITQDGKLVGINTAILSSSGGNVGIGFAIPINMVRYAAEQIIKYGEVKRGHLGVLVQDLTPELAQAMQVAGNGGAVVSQVVPDSPAAKAGVQSGDVVIKLNGDAIHNASELRNRIGSMQPGEKVTLVLLRNGKEMTISPALERLKKSDEEAANGGDEDQNGPDNAKPQTTGKLAGVALSAIPRQHPLYGEVQGVMVAGISTESAAASAGLRPGDIIVSINETPAKSPDQVAEIAKKAGNKPVLLKVRRGPGALFIPLT